jgi:hypothetical protein
MAQDSDVILDFVGTLVWFVVLMLSLLSARYLDGLYGNEPSDVINVLSASWD